MMPCLKKKNRTMKIGSQLLLTLSLAAFIGTACTNAKYEIIEPQTGNNLDTTSRSGELVKDIFSAESYSPLEILFAVDTSSSLVQEREMLQNNMKLFIDTFAGRGFETVRISIMGDSTLPQTDIANCPRTNNFVFPSGIGNVRRINKCIGSNNAISRLSEYYQGTPAPELMAQASLEAIIISDDNGSGAGNTSTDFNPDYKGRRIRVSAVTGIPDVTLPNSNCRLAEYGKEHIQLANRTGGKVYNICDSDWSKLLRSVSEEIASTANGYNLRYPVDLTKKADVFVAGKVLDPTSYTIDPQRNFLRIKDGVSIPLGSKIEISYYTR